MDNNTTNFNNTKVDNSAEDGSTALAILYQVVLALGTMIIFIVLYELIRTSEFGKKIYAPKTYLLPDQTPEVSQGWFGWLKKNAKIDEDYILWNNGLDAVMCLKIYRMGFKIFIAIFFVVGILTVPINVLFRDKEKTVANEIETNKTTTIPEQKGKNLILGNDDIIKLNNITFQTRLPEYLKNNENDNENNENNVLIMRKVKRNKEENKEEVIEIMEITNGNNTIKIDVNLEMNEIIKALRGFDINTNSTTTTNNIYNGNTTTIKIEESERFILSDKEISDILSKNLKFNVVDEENNNSTNPFDQMTNVFGDAKSTLEEFDVRDLFFDILKDDKKNFAYFHLFAVYFVVIYICYLLFKTYQEYLVALEKYVREGGIVQERNISGEILQHNTIMIRNIPASLQDDEKLLSWFNKLGIGKIENVVIARSRSTIRKEIERRNSILANLEAAYVTWIENIKAQKDGEGLITNLLKNFVKEDDTEVMQKLFNEENDKFRPRHFVRLFGVLPIKYVDSIHYYENELLNLTNEIRSLRYEAAESKKWSQTAFITYSNQQSAKIAAQIILYSSQDPSVMSAKCAPHPNDLIYKNLTMHTQQKTYRTFLVYIAMYFVCIVFVSLVFTTDYGMVKKWSENYIGFREVFEFIDTNKYLQPLFESLLQIILINAYMSCVPYILKFLSNFQGFESKSEFAISILRKYYVFLLVNVLFVFTISSFPKDIDNFDSIKDKAMNINIQEVIRVITKEFTKKSVDYLNYGILRFQSFGFEIFRIGPVIMGIIGLLFKNKSPRKIHEKNQATTPPDYSNILAVPMLCYTLFIVFSVINPFIALVGFVYFYLGYHILKNQFIYVYVKEYEAQGRYFITTFNRIIFSLFLFEVFMFGFFLIAIGAGSPIPYLILPTLLITLYFYNYCHKCFKPRTDNVPADLLISKSQEKKFSNNHKRTNIFGRSDSVLSFSFCSEAEETFISCASHVTFIENKSPEEIIRYSGCQVNDLPSYYEAKSYVNPALINCLYSPWIPQEAEEVLSKGALSHVAEVCKKCIRYDRDSKCE